MRGRNMNQRYDALNSAKIKNLQYKEYSNCVKVTGDVPKLSEGGSLVSTINISSYGDFYCKRITGHYSRLVANGAAANDDGTNHLSCQLRDGSNGLELFDTHIPLDLFLSPGGVRSLGVTTGAGGTLLAKSEPLNFPGMPFVYQFSANSTIVFDMKNDSDWANKFTIVLWGTRILSASAVAGIQKPSIK